MADLLVYTGLLLAAFAAATILPMQSEAALVGLLLTQSHPAVLLITIASVGNILGSVVNWFIGRAVETYGGRWFSISPDKIDRASAWYRRYGKWSLLLSWMPIIGDPLTVVAGVLKEPFWTFLVLVAIAKTTRYLVLAAITLAWL